MINLQLAEAAFESNPERAKRYLDAGLRQSECGLAALRDFVRGIHPPILTHLGLQAAVEALVDDCPIAVSLDVTNRRLPAAVEESVYFFVSEAMTNVIRHAHASQAAIQVVAGPCVVVEVRDDGIGGATLKGGGSGLDGLVDRVTALGGDFEFASPPLCGTKLRGVIPMPAEPV